MRPPLNLGPRFEETNFTRATTTQMSCARKLLFSLLFSPATPPLQTVEDDGCMTIDISTVSDVSASERTVLARYREKFQAIRSRLRPSMRRERKRPTKKRKVVPTQTPAPVHSRGTSAPALVNRLTRRKMLGADIILPSYDKRVSHRERKTTYTEEVFFACVLFESDRHGVRTGMEECGRRP